MNTRLLATCVGMTLIASACAGGGSNNAPPARATTLQQVRGTLTIGAIGKLPSSRTRRPLYVSPATGHAALFINGATAAAGSTTSCVPTTGTGTGCTIAWSAQLAVPASYTFAVEVDSGASGSPANTVLAEGAGTYAIVSGNNALSPALSLNGAVANASFTVTSCSAANCSGNVTLSDATDNAIAYTGAVPVPTTGNNPSSGNVYDNGQVTFVSSAPLVGQMTGTAQAPFSTFVVNTLTVAGVNTSGVYTYQVGCDASATGTFGITIGGAASPSNVVTTAQLAALSPAVSYPAAGVNTLPTAPSFSCVSGVISSATGTLPVN